MELYGHDMCWNQHNSGPTIDKAVEYLGLGPEPQKAVFIDFPFSIDGKDWKRKSYAKGLLTWDAEGFPYVVTDPVVLSGVRPANLAAVTFPVHDLPDYAAHA